MRQPEVRCPTCSGYAEKITTFIGSPIYKTVSDEALRERHTKLTDLVRDKGGPVVSKFGTVFRLDSGQWAFTSLKLVPGQVVLPEHILCAFDTPEEAIIYALLWRVDSSISASEANTHSG